MAQSKIHRGEIAILMGVGILAFGIWCYNRMIDKARIGLSEVDGRGVKANQDINKGETIEVVKNGEITEIGKNINHSNASNSEIEDVGGKFNLVATQPIRENEEIYINYEQNPIGFSTDVRGFL
tara:strand:+ start:101 stop:472 length:372 start_codon:yes stop_codon:yes gene_type:complete